MSIEDALGRAGELAAAEAERLWRLDIYDPPIGDKRARTPECLSVIAGIIKRNGWLSQPYKGNGPPQWCGMFAGDVWAAAGLDPKWLPAFFASTMRLGTWARYQAWNEHANPRPSGADLRQIAKLAPGQPLALTPRAGDIVIVGDGTPVDGDHVTVAMGFDPATGAIDTISGNGAGVGPHGNPREGISRHTYTIGSAGYHPMWVIRPAFGDLLAEAPL